MGFSISILSGVQAGTATSCFGDRLLLGSSQDCDLTLSDTGVAPRHCLLGVKQNQLWIRDLKSPHGTRVNGTPLQEGAARRFSSGGVIAVGPVKLRVEWQVDTAEGRSSAVVRWLEAEGEPPAEAIAAIPPAAMSVATAEVPAVEPPNKPAAEHARVVRDLVQSTVANMQARRKDGAARDQATLPKPRASLVAILSTAVAQCRAAEELLTDEELYAALSVVMENVARRMPGTVRKTL